MNVALAMGESPEWVMDTMTIEQAALCHNRYHEINLGFAEMQAAIIWRMANGNYERPSLLSVDNDIEQLKQFPFYEEN